MPQYVLLFRGGAPTEKGLSSEEMESHLSRWNAWVDKHADAGMMTPGKPLETEVRLVESPDVVTDGPYTEAKEIVGGFSTITADTIEEAIAIAKECPIFEYNGQVEVRPVLEMCLDPAKAKTRV